MTLQVPRLPFSLDPLIAEAKRRTRRRRWLTLLVVVAAAAATTAALELRSGSGSGLAAVGPRPVVHVVMEWPPSEVTVDLKTGHRTGGAARQEMWLDRANGRERIAHSENGRVVGDEVWTNHFRPGSEAAAVDQVYLNLATSYRAALKAGTYKRVGRGTFDGHDLVWLHWLQPTPHPWPEAAEDVGVDAHSFKPIVLRFRSSHGTRGGYYGLVLSAKAIPYHPADFKRRGHAHQSRPGQQATGFAFGSTDRSGAGSIVVRAPWLTAGTTVAGLELHAVRPFTIRRSKHRFSYGATKPKAIHGLELVYGPASYRAAPTVPPRVNVYGKGPRTSTRFTTVYEVPRAPRVSPWSSVPADSIQIESGLTTVGTHIVHTLRIGYLQKHGLYITIRTPQSENTAVQIARSLRSG